MKVLLIDVGRLFSLTVSLNKAASDHPRQASRVKWCFQCIVIDSCSFIAAAAESRASPSLHEMMALDGLHSFP